MDDIILSLSDRGQVTIPQKIREKFSVKHFVCKVSGSEIILQPLQTREDFVKDLDKAEEDWNEQGGLTLCEIKNKYKV